MKVTLLDIVKERLIEKKVCFHQGSNLRTYNNGNNEYIMVFNGETIFRWGVDEIEFKCLHANQKREISLLTMVKNQLRNSSPRITYKMDIN